MADCGGEMFEIEFNGVRVHVDAQTVEMLNSTDPNLRQMSLDLLREVSKESKESQGPDLSPSTSTSECSKVWKQNETKALFETRVAYEDKFNSTKCHKVLWAKIASDIKDLGIVATVAQCINKWKSLKREYKKTVDSNAQTGTDKRTCTFFEEFNDLYGHKSGIKPKFLMASKVVESKQSKEDTDRLDKETEENESDNDLSSSNSDPGPSSAEKTKQKGVKRKTRQDKNLEFLQNYSKKQEDFQHERLDLLKQQHLERMAMMDKLIDCLKQNKNN